MLFISRKLHLLFSSHETERSRKGTTGKTGKGGGRGGWGWRDRARGREGKQSFLRAPVTGTGGVGSSCVLAPLAISYRVAAHVFGKFFVFKKNQMSKKTDMLGPLWFYAKRNNGAEVTVVGHEAVQPVMDEFAKQVAILFAVWLKEEDYNPGDKMEDAFDYFKTIKKID